jgi:hypothetical protein
MAKVKINFNLREVMSLPAPGQRTRYKHLRKLTRDIKDGLEAAVVAGADTMRSRVLDSPPTGSSVDDGRRVDTFTMFDSIGSSKPTEPRSRDRRKRSGVSASFGFPANKDGTIKDAPTAPTRGQAGEHWRSDPNYFVMQEYGESMFDELTYPGMEAQKVGLEVAEKTFTEYMKKKGYK